MSATDSHIGNLVDTASSGVDGLAGAATSGLGSPGALQQPVVDGLRDVWEGYFGVPIPPGDTNWNAYTHQQLYDMVWRNAEPADVGSVADLWDQHGTALNDQAGALRNRQTELGKTWTGAAANQATGKLGLLGNQNEAIGTNATTVGQVTRQAGDALTLARNTMPKPLADPLTTVISGAVAGAGLGAELGGALGGDFTGGFGTAPGAMMGAGIGAVAGGAASLFLGSAVAAQRKAEAVRVMTTYESNLRDAAAGMPGTVADTAGIGSAGNLATTTSAFVGGVSGEGPGGGLGVGGTSGGVPWQELVGAGSGAAPLRSGAMSGALTDPVLARAGLLAADDAAVGMTNGEDLFPPMMGRRGRGDDDNEYRGHMPKVMQNPFDSEEGTVVPVIGETDR